jgi:hypothetical protein
MFNPEEKDYVPIPESLANDIAILLPYEKKRKEYSNTANKNNRRFTRTQYFVILGGVILTGLGVVESGAGGLENVPEGLNTVVILIRVALSFALGVFVLLSEKFAWQEIWVGNRGASEAIKHEYFLFLGRVGDYGKEDPERLFDRRVRAIEREFAEYLPVGAADYQEMEEEVIA